MKKYAVVWFVLLASIQLFGQNKLESSGNVGVGTLSPAAELEVNGRLLVQGANLDPNGGLSNLSYLSNTGKLLIGWNRSSGMGETNFISNQGPGGSGGFSFYNYDNSGSMRLLMLMNGNGNIGVGTNPVNEKLAVDGKIKAREIIVTDVGWADHVFFDTYKPLSLKEIDRFITKKKHLPGIPSASDVTANGIKVGEMQAKLLEKIEELTLHLIAQEKRIDVQDNEIKKQKHMNTFLSDKIAKSSRHDHAAEYKLKSLRKH